MFTFPELRKQHPTKWLTMTALLMAMNVVMSSFSIPVPGGHLYLNDMVICTAAILLDPLGA
ncbi:MAG: ECF transporter S component, partial [Eubacteriales bacterium]|nr:ECF transporter S component [Eubacteriales bacterium]